MIRSRHVTVRIDLSVIRANAVRIADLTRVPLLAVVKADAYGLGARVIAPAIADLVDGFYVFDLAEAVSYELAATGLRTITLRAESTNPDDYLAHLVQPAVWDVATATALRRARPVLSIDSGQQRFGVPLAQRTSIDAILDAGGISEAFTHATTVPQAEALAAVMREKVARLHAAGSALLAEPRAILDAVRPGFALYRGAARVSASLVEVRTSTGPAGYTGFRAERHGVILAGYSNGLRTGPCLVNGRSSRILEVGMQSAFVECAPGDKAGDEVVLLGDSLTEQEVSSIWQTSTQEALFRLTSLGEREYVG